MMTPSLAQELQSLSFEVFEAHIAQRLRFLSSRAAKLERTLEDLADESRQDEQAVFLSPNVVWIGSRRCP